MGWLLHKDKNPKAMVTLNLFGIVENNMLYLFDIKMISI